MLVVDGPKVRRLRLAAIRADREFPPTLTGFAELARVDAGQLSRIENGKRDRASFGWVARVADTLGVPVEAVARDEV